MKNDFRSYFSPNLMSKETLEMLFVQRQELAKEVTESIVDSISTSSKHYILLIGPRGIGKTHFTSLIYHRLKDIAAFQEKAVIAWLREEEWGVSSFLDLLIRLLRATLSEESSPTIAEQINKLYEIPIKNAEALAKNLLEELVGNRTLVILMENLNQIFKGLGDKEQRKLRAYLQNNPFCTILATSQSLFDGVSLRDSPFYGFFQIKYLKPLNLEESTELLKNIANHKKDNELARLISSPMGTARIRAIHHLTGGNHRVYIIFSEFLNAKALDDLVEPFMRTLDDLTPYYQSRLNEISAQQQKIIEYLCEERRAVVVKEIAQRCFMTHQTASSHLKTLKEKGYVISHNIGRESYYELQEPLMRLCIEVKMHHDKPIRLFVDFLRFWYSSNDLETRLAATSEDSFERGYLKQAIELTKKEPNPVISICREERNKYISEENWNKALEVVEEMLAILGQEKETEKNKKDKLDCFMDKGKILLKLERNKEALNIFEEIIKIDLNNIDAKLFKGMTLLKLNRFKEALVLFEEVREINPNKIDVRLNEGATLFHLKRYEEALNIFETIIEIDPDYFPAWGNKGLMLSELKRHKEALTAFEKAIELDSKDALAWFHKGVELGELQRYEEALKAFEKAIELDSKDTDFWGNKGVTLSYLKRPEEAIEAFDKAIELAPSSVDAWFNKGIELFELKRYREAIETFEKLIELAPNNVDAWFNKGVGLFNINEYEEALKIFEKVLILDPKNSKALGNKGIALSNLNQFSKALEAFETVTEINPTDAIAWFNKGTLLFKLNNAKEALNAFERATTLNNTTLLAGLLFGKGECLLALDQWNEGYISLDKALSQMDELQKNYVLDTTDVISILFNSTRDANIWQDRIKKLVEIFDKHNALASLEKGLVEIIKLLDSSVTDLKTAKIWRDLWRIIVSEEKLPVAFRFMNVAIKYYENDKDPRVLLELPIEEREILQEVLKSNT